MLTFSASLPLPLNNVAGKVNCQVMINICGRSSQRPPSIYGRYGTGNKSSGRTKKVLVSSRKLVKNIVVLHGNQARNVDVPCGK